MNWLNTYFMICVYVWALDVVVSIAIIAIKPLRKWCWKKLLEISREGTDIILDVFPELKEE